MIFIVFLPGVWMLIYIRDHGNVVLVLNFVVFPFVLDVISIIVFVFL